MLCGDGFGVIGLSFLFKLHLSCSTFTRERRVDMLTGKPHRQPSIVVFYALYSNFVNVLLVVFSEHPVSYFALYMIDTVYYRSCSLDGALVGS